MVAAFAERARERPFSAGSRVAGRVREDELRRLLDFLDSPRSAFAPESRLAIFLIVLWKGRFGRAEFHVFPGRIFADISNKRETILLLTEILCNELGIADAELTEIHRRLLKLSQPSARSGP